jgi:hypothetical protein
MEFTFNISPIDPFILNIIGFYLCLTLFICLLFNTILLIIFIRFKELRNKFNIFIMGITTLNVIGSIEIPFVIYSSFKAKYSIYIYLLYTLFFNQNLIYLFH